MSNHPAPSRVLFDDQTAVLTTDAAAGANLIATADRWRGLVQLISEFLKASSRGRRNSMKGRKHRRSR
jgi:hypothetical protein